MRLLITKKTYLYTIPNVPSNISIEPGDYTILQLLSSNFNEPFIPILTLDYNIYFLETNAINLTPILFIDQKVFSSIFKYCLQDIEESYWFAICAVCYEFNITSISELSIFLALIGACSNSMHQLEEKVRLCLRYNNQVNLGNDKGINYGIKYRGRGLIYIRGYYQYKEYSKKVHLDLINAPQLINNSALVEARIAAMLWTEHNLKELADDSWYNLKLIILRIFHSYTGLEQILSYWITAQEKLKNLC